MSTSTGALAARQRNSSCRNIVSQKLLGGVAVACLVFGCSWAVYSNILTASVYPILDEARYNEPVLKRLSSVAPRSVAQALDDTFAALPPSAAVVSKAAPAPSISASMFNERFAASQPIGVPSRAADASIADTPKPVDAPKVAQAVKPKDVAPQRPAQLALNVPTSAPPRQESKSDSTQGFSIRDMAERAKQAVMSIASHDRSSMTEKLWGKQPSNGPLLSYASADASITGGIAQEQNPLLGGSPPYDRSTAVYDISAHTVYLPDGSKLEAHSGLGAKLDDPHTARIRMEGVTPPHIYELKPRETLFHGVPALRMTPIGGEEAIFGRSGLLAHSFMLGPNGDSNGCVSFRDYNAFLDAYRNQGIKKLAVVARVD
jgi:hypothetical protein